MSFPFEEWAAYIMNIDAWQPEIDYGLAFRNDNRGMRAVLDVEIPLMFLVCLEILPLENGGSLIFFSVMM